MNFLIIGYGSVGKRHASNLSGLGVNCLIVDTKSSRLKEALEHGYSVYDSLDSLDSSETFEAVVICSPPVFHVEQTIWALDRNKKIFLEKPIGINFKECNTILSLDFEKIFVGYNYRWNPQFIKLQKHIDRGLIKNPFFATFTIGMHLEDWHPWENYRDFFMSNKSQGGGALLDESHFLELIIEIFGIPLSVMAKQLKISSLEIDTDDYVSAQFLFHNLLVEMRLDLFRRPHESFIQIYGEDSSITCNFLNKINTVTISKSYAEPGRIIKRFKYERNDVFVDMMKDFIEFVNFENVLPRVTFLRALEVMFLIEKIRESSQINHWLKVDK